MDSTQVVKVNLGADTRRFSVNKSRPVTELFGMIRSTFSLAPSAPIAVTFLDDENDQCTLSTDDELQEAFRVAGSMEKSILRLQVTVTSDAVPVPVPSVPETSVEDKGKSPAAAPEAEPTDPFAGARASLEAFLSHVLSGQSASIEPDWLNELLNNALSAWGGLLGLIKKAEQKALDPNLVKDVVDTLLAEPKIREIAEQFEVVPKQVVDEEKRAAEAAEAAEKAKAEAEVAAAAAAAAAAASVPPFFAGMPDGSRIWENLQQSVDPMMQAILQSPLAQFFLNIPTGRPAAPAAPVASPTLHPNVTCDGCNKPIDGVRYKCTNCPDFDFCAACEASKEHDATHIFLKIKRPVKRSIFCHGPMLPNYYAEGQQGPRCGRFARGCPMRAAAAAPPAPEAAPATPAPAPEVTAAPVDAPKEIVHTSRFVQDMTIPDGTEMTPGTQFVKIWQFRNDGEVAWPLDAVLDFVGGDNMDGKPVAVPPIAPGETADISVDMTAPRAMGRYCGYWRLRSGEKRFGHRVWADVVVAAPASAPDAETPRAAAAPAFIAPVMETTPAPAPEVAPAVPQIPPPAYVATATPAPVVAPAAPPAEPTPLEQLLSMGFDNVDRLQALLKRHNGDVNAVANAYFD